MFKRILYSLLMDVSAICILVFGGLAFAIIGLYAAQVWHNVQIFLLCMLIGVFAVLTVSEFVRLYIGDLIRAEKAEEKES